jgi:hypothetical protein
MNQSPTAQKQSQIEEQEEEIKVARSPHDEGLVNMVKEEEKTQVAAPSAKETLTFMDQLRKSQLI